MKQATKHANSGWLIWEIPKDSPNCPAMLCPSQNKYEEAVLYIKSALFIQ